MKTYLEIQIPFQTDVPWMKNLKNRLSETFVRWQNGFFHITIAFIEGVPTEVDIIDIINQHIPKLSVTGLQFDSLDAFTIPNGQMHIIHLAAQQIPEHFKSWVKDLHEHLTSSGCTLSCEFKLHVTLGRVIASDIELPALRAIVTSHSIDTYVPHISRVAYREYRGNTIQTWNLVI